MKIHSNDNGRKHYRHDYRITNSTTADFSRVQPLLCRMMMPKSSIKGKIGSFVRLAPMPFPSFGDLRWSAVARFVPIEDVYPNFAAFISGKPVSNPNTSSSVTDFIPTSIFKASNGVLFNAMYSASSNMFLRKDVYTIGVSGGLSRSINDDINYDDVQLMPFEEYYDRFKSLIADNKPCVLTSYDVDGNVQYSIDVTDPYSNELVTAVSSNTMTMDEATIFYNKWHNPCSVSAQNDVSLQASSDASTVLQAIDSADNTQVNYSGSYTTSSIVCATLNDRGRALMKILRGLGYSPSSDDSTRLSLLPLLAWCKAYFDEFYPNRGTLDWAATAPARFISYWSSKALASDFSSSDFGFIGSTSYLLDELINFVADSYVVKDADFLSLHTRSLYDSTDTMTDSAFSSINSEFLSSVGLTKDSSPNYILPNSNSSSNLDATSSADSTGLTFERPHVPRTSTPVITDVSLRLLSKLTNMFNRDSLIGNRVSMWMKSHLDSDVYERIYKQTSRISSNDVRIDISDITSTTDMSGTNGSVLGAYAGKGVGVGDMSFDFKADTYGFFIVLGFIKCETGWYQGTDAQLFATSRFDIPQQQFDALGYEVTPFSFIFDDDSIGVRADTHFSSVDLSKNGVAICSDGYGFGYVPRYSGFKYARNCVNGDLRNNSTGKTYSGYFIDRMFNNRSVGLAPSGSPSGQILKVYVNPLPCATTDYQYQEKYDYMSNYNRIFYNSGSYGVHGVNSTLWQRLLNKNNSLHYDNFIVHSVIDWTEINSLKPLSMSFDTQMSSSDTDSSVRV